MVSGQGFIHPNPPKEEGEPHGFFTLTRLFLFPMKKHLLLLLPLALIACAKPMTRAPKVNTDVLAAEQQSQQAMLADAPQSAAIAMLPAAEINARMGRVVPRIRQQGAAVCQSLGGSLQSCTFPVQVADDDALNAWADGKAVYITPVMISFTSNDEELAMVLAHEYAHNVLGHPQSAQQNATVGGLAGMMLDKLAASQGMATGVVFQQVGTNVGAYHYSVPFEKEADYVGLYIMANAGYRVEGMENFWRKFTIYDPNGLYTSLTHPSNPERAVAIQNTVAEINAKRAGGKPLVPELRD